MLGETVKTYIYVAVKTDMFKMVLIKSMKTRHVTHPDITLEPNWADGALAFGVVQSDLHERHRGDVAARELTPRFRLRRQCILCLVPMKSLRRWLRGSLGCCGDWGPLGRPSGDGEVGGGGGGWRGDANKDISYRWRCDEAHWEMEWRKTGREKMRQNFKAIENVQNVLHCNKLIATFIKGNVCQLMSVAKILNRNISKFKDWCHQNNH